MTAETTASRDLRRDPALARCGSDFWNGVFRSGVSAPALIRSQTESAEQWAKRYHWWWDCARRTPATVNLAEMSRWISLPPEHARGYLRAIHAHLEACGVLLLERRLNANGDLGTDEPFGGPSMRKPDKDKLNTDKLAATAELTKANAQLKLKTKAVNAASRAMLAAEKRAAKGIQDDDLDALRAVLDTATTERQQLAEHVEELTTTVRVLNAQHANANYLPLERMGYTVLLLNKES